MECFSVKQIIFRLLLFFVLFGQQVNLMAQESEPKDTLQLDEVEVFGKTLNIFPVQVIHSSSLTTEPVRDIGDYLRQTSNVSGIRKGGISIDPVVRGFKYNQVTVLLNSGIKIEGGCPNRMDPVASHVESENIREIEIIKGPYVLKYGPVLGALINLETNSPQPFRKPEIHGMILYGFESNWNGQWEHFSLSGGNQRVFFNASGGFKGYGSYTAGNDTLYKTSFKKLYGSAGVGIAIHRDHLVSLSYAYDQGKDVLFPALPMDERLDQTHVASFHYSGKNLKKSWQALEFQGYFSSVHHVMDNLKRPSAKTMEAVSTVDATNTGGKILSQFLAGSHKLIVGADFEHVYKDGQKQMTMRMIMEGDTFISVKYSNLWLKAFSNNIGVFSEYKFPVKSMELTAALRFDYNQASSADTFRLVKNGTSYFDQLNSQFFNFSFSFGMKKQLFSWLVLSASIGKGSRSPSLLERFIKLLQVQYDSYDYLGNPQLKPENNYQADLTLDFPIQNFGSVSAGGFFSYVTDYVIGTLLPPSVIKPSTQGAPGVKQFTNISKAYLTGFEFSYQSPVSRKWELQIQAAATYGTQPKATLYIINAGQVVDEETITNDPLPEIPPLEGTISFAYKFFKGKLKPKGSVRLVSEQNRISKAYGELKTPGFITAAITINYSPWKFASINAGVENLFDSPYYEHLNRRMTGTSARLYEPGRVYFINLQLQF